MTDSAVRRVSALAAALAALCALAVASPARAQDMGDLHIINLKDADITAYIEDVSEVTGRTFIVHPAVKGKVTVTSHEPLDQDGVFQVFLSTLRVHGYTALPSDNGAYRIVPDQTAAEAVNVVGAAGASDDQFVTEVIKLRYFDAMEAAQTVRPLINGRGQVAANQDSNVLVVVDYAGNIDRIRALVREMDEDRSKLTTMTLNNVPAAEVARVVNDLGSEYDIAAVAAPSTNAVLLRGEEEAVARIRAMVARLDEASTPTESLRVISLKHADAAEIVPILEAVAATMGRPAGGDGVSIPYHAPTNSLILSADPQTLSSLVRVVEDLDIRRSQVLVEAIIVEVSDDAARELGLQFVLSGDDDTALPFAATNFSQSAPNLLAITGAIALDGEEGGDELQELALSSILGSTGAILGGVGEVGDGGLFGVILNALQTDTESNILSTPSILTLDNAAASILVGQEIPITTGEVLGADNTNPFRTVERKDVGVQLEVLPQINDGDSITLDIRQEVSSISASASTLTTDLVTNKREISTTVLADHGEVIVLGGLIETAESLIESKIPILGDIPLAGRLFSSRGREQTRTNLMVFIRPTIIRDVDEA
ncbi:MAG: type II secretion system secretin GspD, partial [Caulobacterales bacterium]|nr:type II secretion system secretin GspD [Caulobacterales bacterium]